jgi:hypothetical protein
MNIEKTMAQLALMEYCYCSSCMRIKESSELLLSEEGTLVCRQCGNSNLDEPGWVACPHQKMTAVKCPRAGRGIISSDSGLECIDRCFFR